MSTSSLRGCLVVSALFGALVSAASADNIIPLINPSFESPLCDPTYGTTINGTPIDGWDLDNITQAGLWDPSITDFGSGQPPAPDGNQIMYLGYNAANKAVQTVPQVLVNNATYTLTAKAGDFAGYPAGWGVELRAGGNVLASTTGVGPEGNFQNVTVTFNSAGSPYIGQNLAVYLTSAGTQALFDNVKLTTTAPVVLGDLNGDNQVNLVDYGIIKANWLQTVPKHTLGDLSGDGIVTIPDFATFKNYYIAFNGGGAGAGLAQPVPEPGTLVLLAAGLPALFAWRRKRSQTA